MQLGVVGDVCGVLGGGHAPTGAAAASRRGRSRGGKALREGGAVVQRMLLLLLLQRLLIVLGRGFANVGRCGHEGQFFQRSTTTGRVSCGDRNERERKEAMRMEGRLATDASVPDGGFMVEEHSVVGERWKK